jgi:hypothetical protein
MIENENKPLGDEMDQAISHRLARLRSMPVDTSGLERALYAHIPRRRGGRIFQLLALKPLRAAAASVLVLLTIVGVLLMTWNTPVLASASEMAQMHRDIVANRISVVQVSSMDEASRVLVNQASRPPDLPQAPEAHVMACDMKNIDLPQAPKTHVMACCMKNIKGKQVACVLLRSETSPITMSIARAKDMRLPKVPGIDRGGVRYYVQSSGSLTMVSAERHERWICLIGELPSDRLIEIAAGLRFE